MKVHMVPILFVLIDTASGDMNVALNKPTKLSSVAFGGASTKAVDGNTNPAYDQGSCAHSDNTMENQWLCVDLEDNFDIHTIKIFNRKNYEDRLKGFGIRLSYTGKCDSAGFTAATQCYQDDNKTSTVQPVFTIERCNGEGVPSFAGRYVFISVGKSSPQPAILTLCELQIFAENCPGGYYGTNCQIKCPQHCLNDECEKIGGGCSKGCYDGYYGEYCESECNTNCKGGQCNWKTGECNGCKDGYYSDSCSLSCTNCKDSCRLSDGICLTGCKSGYWGKTGLCLQKCPESCGSKGCKINDGTCSGDWNIGNITALI